MKLAPLIKRLRDKCPAFERRVGGAADFDAIEPTTHMKTPCAYVVPLGETGEEIDFSYQTAYDQEVTQTIGVYVFYSLTNQDRRGGEAFDVMDDIKVSVVKALAGLESEDGVLYYSGFNVDDLNHGRLVIVIEFTCTYRLLDKDSAVIDPNDLPDFQGIDGMIDPAPADWINPVNYSIHIKGE